MRESCCPTDVHFQTLTVTCRHPAPVHSLSTARRGITVMFIRQRLALAGVVTSRVYSAWHNGAAGAGRLCGSGGRVRRRFLRPSADLAALVAELALTQVLAAWPACSPASAYAL